MEGLSLKHLHPALGRLWRAERFAADATALPSVQKAAAGELAEDIAHIERHLAGRQWLAGDQPSAVDFELFVLVAWD
jgi:glutathione S-transferase